MKLLGKFGVPALVLAGVLGGATVSQAAPISCPGTAATTDREFTINTTPSATCLAFGPGNVNGNGDAVNALGYITLDKSDDGSTGVANGALTITGSGSTSGTFSILSSVLLSYSNLVIAFKSGEGQFNPDWAAFALPAAALSGTWTISENQSLSHVNLYGTRGATQTVPEPASMLLFGLAALVGARRARRQQ